MIGVPSITAEAVKVSEFPKHFGNAQQTSPTQVSDTLQQEAQNAQQQVQRQAPNIGGILGHIFGGR